MSLFYFRRVDGETMRLTSQTDVRRWAAAERAASCCRWLSIALAATACASNPGARLATRIADADKAAKAALENENQLDVGKIPARTFAVLPFAVAATDTLLQPLAFGLADLLMADLAKSPELQLVERLQTNAILRELDLVDQGVVDPQQGPRVGRLVGARRLMLGEASRIDGGAVRLSARVVDAIAGTVEDLVSADAPIDRIIDAEKALALLLFERLGITLTPAERLRVEQRQTAQLTALVAYGRGVQAEARGDVAAAVAAFEDASRLDAAFSAARARAAGAPAPAAAATRARSVARVIDVSARAINRPVLTRISEAADAPLASGSLLAIILTIRVTP